MPNNFEWQTEDETNWDESSSLETQRPLPPKRSRLSVIIGLLLLVAAGLVAYRQVDNRVTAVTKTIENDIRAGFALHQQAIGANDLELYNSILSGSDLSWTRSQQTLLENELLAAPWTLGLTADAPPQITDINISPDLLEAEVVTAVSFHAPSGNKAATANDTLIQLERTFIYRQGNSRWLHSPPRADFWGTWQFDQTTYLTLHYPQRDEVLAKRLLIDLDTAVAYACTTLADLNCAEDLHLSVTLDSDPASLVETADSQTILHAPTQLGVRLPAPSLIGKPQDEIAYQALLRGYAAHVVSAAIIESIDYQCCAQGLFFQALLDKQLAQLGYRPWPLDDQKYQTLLHNAGDAPFTIPRLWREGPSPRSDSAYAHLTYALIDYVTTAAPTATLTNMQRRLPNAGRYWRWMNRYVSAGIPADDNLQRGWLRYIEQRLALTPHPIPLPDQDIVLLCNTDNSRETTVLRYDTAVDTWTTSHLGRPFLFMNPLPDDSGILLQERLSKEDRTRVLLWRNGQETAVSESSRSTALFRTLAEAQALTMVLYDLSAREIDYQLLSLNSCDDGACLAQSVPAPPVWSDNGRYTLVTNPDNQLWLGDEQGNRQQHIAIGTTPFWLDNNTIGYIPYSADDHQPAQEIIITPRQQFQPQTLLPLSALNPLLPSNRTAAELTIRAIHINPQDTNHLLIAATLPGTDEWHDDGAFLFDYERHSANITLRLHLPFELPPLNPLNFSRNGEWLSIKSFAQTNATSQLHILNLSDETAKSFVSAYPYSLPGYDWSADEKWLLRVEDGFIHLIAPQHNYQRLLIHEQPRCNFAAWVNKN